MNGSDATHCGSGPEEWPNSERDGEEVVQRQQASGEGELVRSGEMSNVGVGEGGVSGGWVTGDGGGEGGECVRSPANEDSPLGVRRRPLVVHNYENFPFNPTGKTPPGNSEATPNMEDSSPTRSRAESNASSGSSAPPLPDRNYSEPDISGGSAPNHTPSGGGDEMRDSLSPLHQTRGQSRSREVKREITEQGQEYAVVNPAWKKNVKGRSPSLTRITDSASETTEGTPPPPLPDRPPSTATERSASQSSDTSNLNLDSELVQQKRDELEVSSRFTESVRYVDVELESKTQLEGPQGRPRSRENDNVTYDTINFPHSQPEGESVFFSSHTIFQCVYVVIVCWV